MSPYTGYLWFADSDSPLILVHLFNLGTLDRFWLVWTVSTVLPSKLLLASNWIDQWIIFAGHKDNICRRWGKEHPGV